MGFKANYHKEQHDEPQDVEYKEVTTEMLDDLVEKMSTN